MTPGLHGIHIHNKGNCTGPSFTSAGEHYNPLGKEHSLNNSKGPHAGDLPNLEVGENGTGHMNGTTDLVTLSHGPTTLFTANGTSLIIHADTDDQMTNPLRQQWRKDYLWGHREKIGFSFIFAEYEPPEFRFGSTVSVSLRPSGLTLFLKA